METGEAHVGCTYGVRPYFAKYVRKAMMKKKRRLNRMHVSRRRVRCASCSSPACVGPKGKRLEITAG